MRVGVVNLSVEDGTKSMLASDYVADPRKIALLAVKTWRAEYPVLDMNSAGGKRLLALVEEAVREGIEKSKGEQGNV
jgi:hypothetical protein